MEQQTAKRPPIFDQMSVIADETRSRILLALEGHELTVSEICSVIQAPQSTVSRHLRVLSDGGWAASRPDGPRRLYHLTVEGLDDDSRGLWALTRRQVAETPASAQDALRREGVLSERRTRSRAFFAGAAGQWDRLRDELFGRRTSLLGLLELIDPDHVIADLGCGTGAVTEALAPVVDRLIAVDGSRAMLDAARDRLAPHAHVELRQGELEALPIEPRSIDLATLILVLHHLPDPGKVVAEVARILRPSGRVLIVDMLPHDREEYRHEMGHVWLGISEERTRRYLVQAGFDSIRHRTLPPEPGAQGPLLFAASASPAAPVPTLP